MTLDFEPREAADALTDEVSRCTDAVEHREVQVVQGRLLCIDEVPSRGDRPTTSTGEEDRQVLVVVAVSVTETAAVDDH